MTDGLPGPGDDLPARAAAIVRERTALEPAIAVVLGSGLGPALAADFDLAAEIAFTELPGFPPPGVPGHEGALRIGRLAGVAVAAFSGRVHLYEGYDPDVPALVPRLARELGARTIVVTAAVGGLEPGVDAGTVVIVRDHLNLMGTVPLGGWRYPDGTPAFIDVRAIYEPALADLALERAHALGIAAVPGVYGAMRGPAFETPAEIAMLQRLGATVVGMSMVPETLPARALEMRVLGICSLTNAFGEHVRHEDVVRVSNETARAVGRLLVDLVPLLPAGDTEGA
ncbi:MAG TPA: purine-nucleoside phosphorylase [Actinomycetota bacterium]|nr:purine-nucleoside phosphorylase [Actinomycetota bacterium]